MDLRAVDNRIFSWSSSIFFSSPFTNRFLELSKDKNALCIGISNNESAELFKKSNLKIFLDTRQEVVAGSTRLKAGTSQKACLNIITTILIMSW